jgi:hypothetical protein
MTSVPRGKYRGSEGMAPTKIFRGKDKADIDAQVWEWKVDNPKIIMVDTYPIERLAPCSRHLIRSRCASISRNPTDDDNAAPLPSALVDRRAWRPYSSSSPNTLPVDRSTR